MKNSEEHSLQAPPGAIAALTAGFELATANIWLILLPIVLDLFYWLGPRLSVVQLADRWLSPLLEEPSSQEAVTQFLEMADGVNVFTFLRVPIIGVPALMGGLATEKTPVPIQVHEIDRMLLLIAVVVGLSVLGLFVTAIYLSLISLALRDKEEESSGLASFARIVFKSTARLFGLGLIFLVVLCMVWLPLLPVAFLIGLLAGGLAVFVMLAGLVLVIIYLSLSVPGIVLNGRPLLKSVLESIQMVHGNAAETTTLLLLVALVSFGTNRLWHLADDGSWLTVVSIAGHAFISTALAAAIFVFYRDRWSYTQAQPSDV